MEFKTFRETPITCTEVLNHTKSRASNIGYLKGRLNYVTNRKKCRLDIQELR